MMARLSRQSSNGSAGASISLGQMARQAVGLGQQSRTGGPGTDQNPHAETVAEGECKHTIGSIVVLFLATLREKCQIK